MSESEYTILGSRGFVWEWAVVDSIIHKLHINEAFFKSFIEERLAEEMAARAKFLLLDP